MENQSVKTETVTLVQPVTAKIHWRYYIVLLVLLPFLVFKLFSLKVDSITFLVTIGPLVLIGLIEIFLLVLRSRIITVDSNTITVKYKFLPKSTEFKLTECFGYFPYSSFNNRSSSLMLPNNLIKGVIVQDNNGRIINMMEIGQFLRYKGKPPKWDFVFRLTRIRKWEAQSGKINKIINILEKNNVRLFKSQGTMKGFQDVEKIARKTFKDPNYKPGYNDTYFI